MIGIGCLASLLEFLLASMQSQRRPTGIQPVAASPVTDGSMRAPKQNVNVAPQSAHSAALSGVSWNQLGSVDASRYRSRPKQTVCNVPGSSAEVDGNSQACDRSGEEEVDDVSIVLSKRRT